MFAFRFQCCPLTDHRCISVPGWIMLGRRGRYVVPMLRYPLM